VDLGATNVRVVIANEDGDIEARRSFPYEAQEPERTVRSIGKAIDELVRGVWVGAKVAAIGMALPGTVDPRGGSVASAANLPGWGAVPIASILGAERGVPVAVENDANAAIVGEAWLGAARDKADAVFIALGTGIGTGLWLGGRLHRGAHFLAGEAAFFTMTRGQLRERGWEHNLEAIVGGRAVAAVARKMLGPHGTAAELFERARSGDGDAAAWLAEYIDMLAMALADMIAFVDPEIVVLGGGITAAQGDWLLPALVQRVHAHTPITTPIERSQLGADAQVLGAVRLALARTREEAL
jgi:predicted NBD/HSP70 family sugar kinase